MYAIGDMTGIPLAIGKPLPKAGVLAHGQAEGVAHSIVAEIAGAGTMMSFQAKVHASSKPAPAGPVSAAATSTPNPSRA